METTTDELVAQLRRGLARQDSARAALNVELTDLFAEATARGWAKQTMATLAGMSRQAVTERLDGGARPYQLDMESVTPAELAQADDDDLALALVKWRYRARQLRAEVQAGRDSAADAAAELHERGVTGREIAQAAGVSSMTISRLLAYATGP